MPDGISKDTKPRQRGGARPGTGPKPKSATGEKLSEAILLRLTPSQSAKVAAIAATRGKTDPQDVIRDLIDEASQP